MQARVARQGHSCAHWLSRGSCGLLVARFDGGHRGDVSAAGVRVQIVQTTNNTHIGFDILHAPLLLDAVDSYAELLAAKLVV